MDINKNVFGAVFFGALALFVIFPLLSPGFILTLDAVAVPFRLPFPSLFSPFFLFDSIRALLSLIISTAWLQKIWLFLIFFLAGWGMFRLTGRKNLLAGLFAGSFFAINPFVYERVMAGHWGLLLGYSLLPFLLEAVMDKKAILPAIILTLILSIDVHFALIFAPILLISFMVSRNIKQTAIFLGLTLVLNLNWLIPVVLGRSELGALVSSFDVNDLIAFQSLPDKNFGLIFNLLSGFGFWGQVNNYYLSLKDIVLVWPVLSLAILSLAIAGIYAGFKNGARKDKILTVGLAIMVILALDFAGGVGLASGRDWIITLYNNIPVLRGLREPQKLIGLVMFAYAFLGAYSVEYLWETIVGWKKQVIVGLILILPFVYTPIIFGGFWGQLKPVSYPAGWFTVKEEINQDKAPDYLTLVFPWHQYLRFGFANNMVVVNPAPDFFGKTILSAQNYETKSLYSHDVRPEALHIEGLLSMEKEGKNLTGEEVTDAVTWGQSTGVIGIKYIILAKEADWETYSFLDKSPDLEKIFEDKSLILYRNSAWQKDSLLIE